MDAKPKVWTGPTRRPRISLEHPKEWNRPLAKGVLPVYDLALAYIREDSQNLKDELMEVTKELRAAGSVPVAERDVARVEFLQEKAHILEIQSQINLPDVRWKAANGMGSWSRRNGDIFTDVCAGDMHQLIYRHLSEKRWREEGALDLLVRVSAMQQPQLLSWPVTDGAYSPDECRP